VNTILLVHIGATWRIRWNLCFLRPAPVHSANGKSIGSSVFGRPLQVTVPALRYGTACPVCLSWVYVTLVYCGQTVTCIKMPLGTKVGFGPDDIVLDLEPAPSWPPGKYDWTCASLDPSDSTTHMINRSDQPFLYSSRQSVVGHIGATWQIQ